MIAVYRRTLDVVLRHRVLTLLVLLLTIALTVQLYIKTPKGYFPQDDTGLVFGGTRASPDISFKAMIELQQRVVDIVLADPAVAAVGSSIGTSSWSASVNRGQLFISLKPLSERGVPTQRRHQSAATQAAQRRRHARLHGSRAGCPHRRPPEQLAISIHSVGPQCRRGAALDAARRSTGCSSCPSSSTSTPTASRAACRPM